MQSLDRFKEVTTFKHSGGNTSFFPVLFGSPSVFQCEEKVCNKYRMNMRIKYNKMFNVIYLENMIIYTGQEVYIGWILFKFLFSRLRFKIISTLVKSYYNQVLVSQKYVHDAYDA